MISHIHNRRKKNIQRKKLQKPQGQFLQLRVGSVVLSHQFCNAYSFCWPGGQLIFFISETHFWNKHFDKEFLIEIFFLVYVFLLIIGVLCKICFHFLGDTSSDLPDVPQNHKRALCDLTVADRLAIYDHVIQQASQQSAKRESNEDLYVDLVAKLKKGTWNTLTDNTLALIIDNGLT